MKKTLLTFALTACAASLFAQGSVELVTRNTGAGFFAPVYNVEPGNVFKTGNSAAGLPAGAQVYNGGLLSGTGYRAVLFGGAQGSAEGDLTAAGAFTTFRTGTTAGALASSPANIIAGAPADGNATAQLRVWADPTGAYATWAAAEVAWNQGLIAAGKSALFDIIKLGGGATLPPQPVNLRSFNIYMVPEPSTFVLAGLGAAGLLIFRRRK